MKTVRQLHDEINWPSRRWKADRSDYCDLSGCNRIMDILDECRFEIFDIPFEYILHQKGDGYLLQVSAFITCNEHGEKCWQKGGKHYISSHACDSEIVNKYWKACQDFVLHEAREGFKFKGQQIYQPHWDVDQLAKACKSIPVARRTQLL